MTFLVTVTWQSLVAGAFASASAYCIGLVCYSYKDEPKVRRVLWGVNG